jgi:hypothetical protein
MIKTIDGVPYKQDADNQNQWRDPDGVVYVHRADQTLEQLLTDLAADSDQSIDLGIYAANKRYAVETAGITIGGSTIATDRESQAMITGAYNYLQANPAESVQFKTKNGFVDLDATAMTVIATAVGAHVQACFAREAAVAAAIDDETVTTTAEIDAAFADVTAEWPR